MNFENVKRGGKCSNHWPVTGTYGIKVKWISTTSCTRANNSQAETAKYWINKNYSTLILNEIMICTYKSLVLGDFVRR
jgi:hypothetical protein